MKINPISSGIRRVLPRLVLLFSLAYSGVAFAQQSASGPSLEETIAYINSHSSKRPNAEGWRIQAVSVSLDTSLLIVQSYFPGYCGVGCDGTEYKTIPFRVVSKLKPGYVLQQDGTGEVSLSSGSADILCVHRRIVMPPHHDVENGKSVVQRDRQSDTNNVVAAVFDDADQAERLKHALSRLIALLDERYQRTINQRDPNDPFK
jgi:hypothetical protein